MIGKPLSVEGLGEVMQGVFNRSNRCLGPSMWLCGCRHHHRKHAQRTAV